MAVERSRDVTYDVLKGVAILLVILGHTIQYLDKDFDNNMLFKIIYSFHMPLFIFVSGAILSINYEPNLSLYHYYIRLKKSLLRLFLPFLSWTIILYFTTTRYETIDLVEWFRMVAHHLDYSLWFFMALLLCIVFFYATQFVVEFFLKKQSLLLSILGSFIIFLLVIILFPPLPGLAYLELYYPYFLMGMVWNLKLKKIDTKWLGYIVTPLFFLLVSIWTRTEDIFLNEIVESLYRIIVALFGIYITYHISRFVALNKNFIYLKKMLTLFGAASLGIYAVHFNFIEIKPYFISVVLLSMVSVYILRKSKVLSFVLLGENRFKKVKN